MTNERIKMEAAKMDTHELANWLQNLADERRGLQGHIQGNKKNVERNHYLKRYIRILAKELNSREPRMKGF